MCRGHGGHLGGRGAAAGGEAVQPPRAGRREQRNRHDVVVRVEALVRGALLLRMRSRGFQMANSTRAHFFSVAICAMRTRHSLLLLQWQSWVAERARVTRAMPWCIFGSASSSHFQRDHTKTGLHA